MDIIYDTADKQFFIETPALKPWGADVNAILRRHGKVVSLRGIKMQLKVLSGEETLLEVNLPPPNVQYVQTSQDTLARARVQWKPDQEIVVEAWLKKTDGQEVTATTSFIAPRPAQPYPSWEWAEGKWNAPEPYPTDSDGKMYKWDESSLSWVEYTEEEGGEGEEGTA